MEDLKLQTKVHMTEVGDGLWVKGYRLFKMEEIWKNKENVQKILKGSFISQWLHEASVEAIFYVLIPQSY